MCLHVQALAFERLLLVIKTQPATSNPPPRPRIAELRPVNENLAVSYPVRSAEAHQRVPLEPLFHIDTESQPAAQPMSFDAASDLHSIEAQSQTHAVDGDKSAVDHSPAKEPMPAQHSHAEENGVIKPRLASPTKAENLSQVSPTLLLERCGCRQHTYITWCSLNICGVAAPCTQFLQVEWPVSRTVLMSVRGCAAVLRCLWLFVDCDCTLRQECEHVQPGFACRLAQFWVKVKPGC